MISIQSRMAVAPQAMCEYQASQDGKFAWFVCTWHPEMNFALEEIQAEIKLEIINSGIRDLSKMEAEKWMKDLFSDFHWKLHARLRKTDLAEKGISLFFGIVFEQELFFVQFGRIFCAATDKDKLRHIGQNWKNFHVQSHSELNLLGFSEGDIKIRPQRHLIETGQRFIILPGAIANKVFASSADATGIVPLIESFSNHEDALWLILSGVQDLVKTKRRRITKLHITSTVLILITLATILYMTFGNRSIDLFFRKAKMMFQSRQPVRLDQIPNVLRVDNSNLIKYLERAVNLPARAIELNMMWNTDLPFNVTAAPAFNLENIYLASDNNLIAYNKKTRQLLWKQSLEADIISILSTRTGLIVALENNRVLGFRDDGTKVWQRNIPAGIKDKSKLQAVELTNNENPRIDGSITIIPTDRGLNIVDSYRGESLSEITLTEKMQFISDYDGFDSCFYAVVANTIVCLELKIVN